MVETLEAKWLPNIPTLAFFPYFFRFVTDGMSLMLELFEVGIPEL